jgi:class 3 adenylate cyclase
MRRRDALLLAALAFAALTLALHVSFGAAVDFLLLETLGLLFIAAGAVAWWRRPEVRTGPLLTLSGVLWYVGSYNPMGIDTLSPVSFALSQLYDLPLAYLLLTFPADRLAGVRGVAVGVLGLGMVGRATGRLLLNDPPTIYPEFCAECPRNGFALLASRTGYESVESATSWLIAAAGVLVVIVAVVRWTAAPALLRRVGWPLLGAGILAMAMSVLDAAEFATGTFLLPDDPAVEWAIYGARALVPLGFLVSTLRLRRERLAVAEVALHTGGTSVAALERALSSRLGDPGLAVLRWSVAAGEYLDREGRAVSLPEPGDRTRAVTYIDDEGRSYAAVIHDALLGEERSIAAALQSAARQALRGEDLRAAVGNRADTARLPRGDVTLLFSDIEGSTGHLQRLGRRYADVLEEHRSIIRKAVTEHGGHVVEAIGDEFVAAFTSPSDAARAAIAVQRAMRGHAWADGVPIAVRIGVHRGNVDLTPGGYVGLDVHRAARIMAAANGGQVVASEAVAVVVADDVPEIDARRLGPHSLRGIDEPIALALFEEPDVPSPGVPIRAEPAGARGT